MKNLTRQSIKNNWFNKLVIIALLLVIPLSPSWATTTVAKLKEWSEGYTDSLTGNRNKIIIMRSSLFMGYVSGVAEATVGTYWCVNSRVVTGEQTFDIVMDIIRKVPSSYYDKPAAAIIAVALRLYYPCHDDSNE